MQTGVTTYRLRGVLWEVMSPIAWRTADSLYDLCEQAVSVKERETAVAHDEGGTGVNRVDGSPERE